MSPGSVCRLAYDDFIDAGAVLLEDNYGRRNGVRLGTYDGENDNSLKRCHKEDKMELPARTIYA